VFALLAQRLDGTRAGSKASPVINAGPKRLLRNDGQVFHRAVGTDERLAYLGPRRGMPFGDICTLLNLQNVGDKITERVLSRGLVSRLVRLSVISRRVKRQFPGRQGAPGETKIIASAAHAGSATCPGTNGEEG
jgi:hypothetical protein